MKFRAQTFDPVHMKEFHGIISTLSKISREAYISLQPDRIIFISPSNTTQSTPCIWAEIARAAYFTDYTMAGAQPETDNKIMLSFNAIKFAGALSTLGRGASSRYLKLKLTEKQFPCITVDLEVPSSCSAECRKVTHDVPVKIISSRDWDDYRIPTLPTDFDTNSTIALPSLRSARNLMDKIKNLSPTVTVYCNNLDSLSFVCETDMVTVASHYRNLSVTLSDGSKSNGAEDEVACRVSAKQFAMFLSSNQMLGGRTSCSIGQDQLIKVFTDVRPDVSLNCILYAVNL